LVRISGTPIAAAAVSSSRIAIQARPKARVAEPHRDEHGDEQQEQRRVEVELGAVRRLLVVTGAERSCSRSPKPGESIGDDPERAVRQVEALDRVSPFRTNCGMISPKPSVTIAR
jgi:hypothetical protein